MLKADLHIHTADDPSDHISYSTLDVIEHAAELGYGAIAITLHDAQLDPAPLQAYAAARGIVLVHGIERSKAVTCCSSISAGPPRPCRHSTILRG
jgi:predicted metal-dependent phosphoesterase TrpH